MNSIQEVQEEVSVKASSEIHYYIKNILGELKLFSEEIGKTNRFEKDLNTRSLKNLLRHNPSIYSLSIIDIEGNEITKIVRHDPKTSSELKDVSAQEKFKKALEEDYYLGPIYISEYQLPFISISSPIQDENDTIIGVLDAEVDLSPMWDTTSKIRVKKTGYIYVVDQRGRLIAYKDISLVMENLDLKQIQGVKNFLNNIRTSETYTSFNNEKVIGNWKSIDTTGWGVIVELPVKEIFQELSTLLFLAGLSIILFVLFIAVLLIIVFKKLLKPVTHLQEGVKEVRMGNLDYKIKIISKDELGDLADTFNQMTTDLKESHEKIRRHERELEKLVEKRTEELKKKVKELEDTRTAVLNMLEDVSISKGDLEKSQKDLIKLNEALEKANIELKRMDEYKNEFISMTAHELKTPLASIHGFAGLLKNEKIMANPEQRNYYLSIIIEDSMRLKKLIDDILDLSRIDLGTLKFVFEETDIREAFKGLVKELYLLAAKKGITLKANVANNVPQNFVTDKSRFIQILVNLVNNAVKYTVKKNKKIFVSASKQEEQILFSVKDEGIGIKKKYFSKIFERFYQVDSSYTRKAVGSGLGLAICKGMVEAMGGKIWLKSQIGKGTTFFFTLPIKSKLLMEEKRLEVFKMKKEKKKKLKVEKDIKR
ncbi:hypothetical protein AYK26_03865 [Euryarchaeota archaeon SM23-78]|nr:MAG: hypothetical protein AYK26_03865 [Euryarchaeota archaeon SM23-78]